MWIWILSVILGAFFVEQSTSMKKKLKDELDHYQLSLLTVMAMALFSVFSVVIAWNMGVTLSVMSVSLFVSQIFLSLFYYPILNKAIHQAERSTFSILGCMTLPILLVSDIMLGYGVNAYKILGIIVISVVVVYILATKTLSLRWCKDIVLANWIYMLMMIAFKYSTYHFASTEMVNLLITLPTALLFIPIVLKKRWKNWLKQTFSPKYFWIAGLYGVGWVLIAESYKTLIASSVMLFKQFFAMIFGLITGKLLFHEWRLYKKIIFVVSLGVGIVLMCVG